MALYILPPQPMYSFPVLVYRRYTSPVLPLQLSMHWQDKAPELKARIYRYTTTLQVSGSTTHTTDWWSPPQHQIPVLHMQASLSTDCMPLV